MSIETLEPSLETAPSPELQEQLGTLASAWALGGASRETLPEYVQMAVGNQEQDDGRIFSSAL